MAAVAEGRSETGIYWINDNDDQGMVYVPGLNKKMVQKSVSSSRNNGKAKGKASLDSRVKSGKKLGLPTSLLPVESHIGNTPLQKTSALLVKPKTPTQVSGAPLAQALPHTSQSKSKASLKDLCPEDKRRVANLIEELARVSEEKEESVQRLRDEQETFEKKIQQLEQQNLLIVQERESLRQQYRECQELLGLYQQYLSQQQEKLNKSIAQLNQSRSHCKMAGGERALGTSRDGGGRGTAMDGSYLDLPSTASKGGQGEPAGCSHSFYARPQNRPPSTPSTCKDQDTTNRDGRPTLASRSEQPDYNVARPRASAETRGSRHGLGPKNANECSEEHSETVPPLGRQDWEEKRKCLLLQKKQLEVERERLQARLAQQEERLLRQNQELRQSRLNYSRIQQAASGEVERSFNGIEDDKGSLSCTTTVPHSEGKVGGLRAGGESLRQPLSDVHPQECSRNIQAPEPILSQEHSVITKKDVATSPVYSKSPKVFQKSTTPMATPHSIPRSHEAPGLNSSLIELLDIFSPIANPVRSRVNPSSHQSFTAPRQPARTIQASLTTLHTPPRQTQLSQQDLEESQILEDIFFIC